MVSGHRPLSPNHCPSPPVASHPENPQILQILIQTAQNTPPTTLPATNSRVGDKWSRATGPYPLSPNHCPSPPVASHPENPQILQILIQTAQNTPPTTRPAISSRVGDKWSRATGPYPLSPNHCPSPPVASHPENPQILQILIQTAQNTPPTTRPAISSRVGDKWSRATGPYPLSPNHCPSPPVASHPENPQILQILIQTAQNTPPTTLPATNSRVGDKWSRATGPYPLSPNHCPSPPVASHPENPQILQILIQTAQNAPPSRTLARRASHSRNESTGQPVADSSRSDTWRQPNFENAILGNFYYFEASHGMVIIAESDQYHLRMSQPVARA